MAFLNSEAIESVKEDIKTDDRYVILKDLPQDKPQRFRFCGPGVTGYEIWVTDEEGNDQCIRYEVLPDELPENIKPDMNGKKDPKRFIAGIVYDEQLDKFRLLRITQTGVMKQLFAFMDDPDYGDPNGYDIKITRTEEKKKVAYKVLAAPPKPLAKDIADRFKAIQPHIDLNAMYDNEDIWGDSEDPKYKK